jgi:hypothetical protein
MLLNTRLAIVLDNTCDSMSLSEMMPDMFIVSKENIYGTEE